jgi:translocon-associated protein subunit alpha
MQDDEGGDVASEPPSSEEALSTADSEVEGEEELGPSPDADFVVIFNNKKTAGTTDLVAGEVTTALIGLSNTGSKDFIITAIEGSLRFPQDFSYHIQNFSANYYEQYVSPETDASFVYAFQPSEMFTSRSFGFVISVYYKDIVRLTLVILMSLISELFHLCRTTRISFQLCSMIQSTSLRLKRGLMGRHSSCTYS